jgi:PAS domain S-box-containing protein
MTKESLHILMLEDNPLDAELNNEQLQLLEEYNCIVKVIQDRDDFLKEIESDSPPELILCDYNLPQYNGMKALRDLKLSKLIIPFIFVTGTMQEEIAADAIKAGAWDYVVKDRLFRLPLAVRGALGLKKERELARKAKEKIKRLIKSIDQTSVQIIITNKNHIIEYVNQKVCEVTGLEPHELIGKDAIFFGRDEKDAKINQEIERCLENGEVFKGEIQGKSKTWELISITPIKNEMGEITNYIGVKEDITERKRMEQDLIVARNKAEESDRLKTAFLQNMSHEIRTPLNAICGFSELLLDSGSSLGKQEYFVSIIQNSSNQLLSILNDIFTISSLQTNQEIFNIQRFNVNEVIDELKEINQKQLKNKDVSIIVRKAIPKDQAIISTDRTKLTQILSNLINNAIKFTSKGIIEFGYSIKNDIIEFFVKDSGIGIHPDHHEIIFERFRQADNSIRTNYGGSGLGLSIAKGYVELQKGKIWVESELNKGAVFRFTIPARIHKKISNDTKFTSIETDRRLKILIAEDEKVSLSYMQELFSNKNIDIITANNGKKAIEACKTNPDIDLVLMDIKMPGIDGYSAAKIIKEFNADLPIIAQTAYALDPEIEKYKDIFDDYITKPIKPDILFDAIHQCINKNNLLKKK